MNIIKHILLTLTVSILFPAGLWAQFYVTGDDPGSLKWNIMDTDNFSIIYPQGTDSLARVYGYKLEKYRTPVSRTTGYTNKDRMPVVMHTYNAANGSVAWAPKRMDLFTIPSPYEPEPIPWSTMLSVHEGRHVTQMQFGMTKAQKPFYWLFGEMWNILVSLVYPGMANIEGDAVIAETALTMSGRGRTADFLNYYKVAFDNGDFRKWHQWRFMSQRRYSPDHYALGYLTLGGFRYMYDNPMFMNEIYSLAARRPYQLTAQYSVIRKLTGKKYEDAFQEVAHAMHDIWKAEDKVRAPFIPMEPISKEPRLYADYQGTTVLDNIIYSIKSGHETSPVLVSIDSTGKEKILSRFAHTTSGLKTSPSLKRLYWSENSTDARWSLKSDSRIRYINLGMKGKRTLTDTENLLYNPDINLANNFIATVEYHTDGRSSIVVVNGVSGEKIVSISGPSEVQLIETAWVGEMLVATGITENGYGVYRWTDGSWSVILEPQPVKIKDFKAWENKVMFTCDRTGVNELYHLDPSTGELRQKTVTRYGASDFSYDDEGKYLYYSSQTMKGMQMFRTAAEDLIDRPADFAELHRWTLADKLAEQEKEVAIAQGSTDAVEEVEVNFSEPRRYRKFPHAFNIHSWTPFYVNVDNIMNTSFDYIWQAASLGTTFIMQNRLATAVGEFGYSAHKDPYEVSKWRHSGHAKFTYSGLYPVIEASIDFNDRAARQYSTSCYITEDGSSFSLSSTALLKPSLTGNLSVYIPWDLSSGGWYRGVIPKVSYRISNDMFNTSMAVMKEQESLQSGEDGTLADSGWFSFLYATEGRNTFRHSLSGSLRAYTMLSTPSSAVYPKWGIGVEVGASGGLESKDYLSPMGYGYVYGYVPGILSTHGFKLTAMHQMKLSDAIFGQAVVNIMPRGLSSNASLLSWISVRNDNLSKVTVDYAFPIYLGDIGIGGTLFSIKRLVVSPHFDYTFAGGYGLFSAGAELSLTMNSLLGIAWPYSVGITYSYNGGNGFDTFALQSGISIGRHFVGPTFSVSF
ncbi:MAG: hypothetical protein J6V17_04510 [Bacteroidales bacterium]|nr:hypothetical protein [Bacteroidales bacterium]